jgi:hypothetical protein
MKKMILGGVVGGLVLFIWGYMAWMVLPLHDASVRPLPAEDAVIAALQSNVPEKGVYMFPGMAKGASDASMETWKQKVQRGPIGTVIFDPRGADPMMTDRMAPGFLICLLSALLAAWFLSRSTAVASSYVARVAFCGMLGIFLSLSTYLMMWNWMWYPLDYTTAMIADAIIGWLLTGAVIAAFVKSPPAPRPA